MNKPRFVRSSVIGKSTNKHTIHLLCTGLTIIWWWVEPGIVCNLKLNTCTHFPAREMWRNSPPYRPSCSTVPIAFWCQLPATQNPPLRSREIHIRNHALAVTTRFGQIPAGTTHTVYKKFCNNCVSHRFSRVRGDWWCVNGHNAFL